MAKLNPLANLWTIVKEADLRPLRDAAERDLRIAIVGRPGSGRAALAERMQREPAHPDLPAVSAPLIIMDLDAVLPASQAIVAGSGPAARLAPQMDAELVILVIAGSQADTALEQELVRGFHAAGKPVLVFVNHTVPQLAAGADAAGAPAALPSGHAAGGSAPSSRPAGGAQPAPAPTGRTRSRGVVRGPVNDDVFLTREFAPAVIELIPDRVLALGRCYPLFRVPVAHYLINDTCFTNAAYAFSTALAETVAVLNVPIAMTDMVILTKNQLFLVYKLGLAVGFSTRWQDYVAEFGGVLGTGFLFRQLARTLVGMVPVWGIIPKTAISYAGTYTVGNVVLQWYLTGRHLEPAQVKQLYTQAFDNGKALARRLLRRSPRLPGGRSPAELEDGSRRRLRLPQLRLPKLSRRKPALTKGEPGKICPDCSRLNAPDARFCQYCGHVFEPAA